MSDMIMRTETLYVPSDEGLRSFEMEDAVCPGDPPTHTCERCGVPPVVLWTFEQLIEGERLSIQLCETCCCEMMPWAVTLMSPGEFLGWCAAARKGVQSGGIDR